MQLIQSMCKTIFTTAHHAYDHGLADRFRCQMLWQHTLNVLRFRELLFQFCAPHDCF